MQSSGHSNSSADSKTKINLHAFRKWMVAVCAIRFDLTQGQIVEACYPPHSISTEEESDIAYSSFPDSVTGNQLKSSLHDSLFFFRIRRRGNYFVQKVENPNSLSSQTSKRRDISRQSVTIKSPSPKEKETLRSSFESTLKAENSEAFNLTKPAGLSKTEPAISSFDSNPTSSPPSTECFRTNSDSVSISNGPESSSIQRRLSNSFSSLDSPHLLSSPSSSSPTRPSRTKLSPSISRTNSYPEASANLSHSSKRAVRYLYGFVFNRQRHDKRLKRGGDQKSVVILSEHPFSSVLKPLAQLAGPLYFDLGLPALEQVASLVAQWPPPQYGSFLELSLGSFTLRASLPPAHTLPTESLLEWNCVDDFTSAIAPPLHADSSVPQGIFHDTDLFGIHRGILLQLWVLWELLLIGEPLLVIAPSPSQCSEAVSSLISLIAPLPCSVDFRPYFTIHDPDFPSLNALKDGEEMPSMILGVTNLFFLKALRTVPHVLSVGSEGIGLGWGVSASAGKKQEMGLRHVNSQVPAFEISKKLQFSYFMPSVNSVLQSNIFRRVLQFSRDGPLSLMSQHKEALWTNYIPYLKPDISIINRLIDPSSSPSSPSLPSSSSSSSSAPSETLSVINNDIIRRHFLELTTNFLAPFGPYLRANTPPVGSSPFVHPPPLPAFDAHTFLEQLAARGPGKFFSKRLRQNSWIDLYQRFMHGPNFMPWFQRRRAVAEAEQHRLWRKARESAEVRTFVGRKSEGELVEAFDVIQLHILLELEAGKREGHGGESVVVTKLRSDLKIVYEKLPRNIQQSLLFNSDYAYLVQGINMTPVLPGRPLLRDKFEK